MSQVIRRSAILLVAVAAILVVAAAPGAARAQDGYVGSSTCAECHEDIATGLARSAHGVAPNWDAEHSCESCHGPGQAHVDGDTEAIVRPQDLPPAEASAICMNCHSRQEKQMTAASSAHALNDVSCIDCHSPHSTAEQFLTRRGVELCGSCHQTIVAQFDQPRSHPLPRDGKACENCHDPHTGNSLSGSRGFANNVCAECHFEKTAPFIYQHDVAVVDSCNACHTVHGSTNRHLLTHERQINLCYQCHPGTTTPTFHNAYNFANEKCTACHTAIHGSNTNPFFLEE